MEKELNGSLRIGLIIPSLEVGGSEKHVVKLANFLNSKNVNVSIILLSKNIDDHLISDIANDVKVHKLYGNPIKKIALARKTVRDFNLNCVMGFLNLGNILMILLPIKLCKIATIRNVQKNSLKTIPKNILLRLSYAFADLIVTNNYHIKSKKIKSKLIFIPNTIETKPLPSTWDVSKRKKINITTCSNFRPIKGLLEYCEILCKLDTGIKNQIRITIIGRGSLEKEIKEILIRSEIEFDVKTDIYTVSEELINSEIYIHPSLSEGFSNSILEAMAHKLPIISTNVGSAEIQLGSKKYLYEPNSGSKQLIGLLSSFVENDKLRKQEGLNNLARVMANFSEEKMESGYIEVFNRVGYDL